MSSGLITFTATQYPIGTTLLLGGGFEDSGEVANWTGSNATLASISGGQSGNRLQLTTTGGSYQYATQSVTLIPRAFYQLSVWVKSGTSGNEPGFISINGGVDENHAINFTSTSSWQSVVVNFQAVNASLHVNLAKYSATAGTMLFDQAGLIRMTPGIPPLNSIITADFDYYWRCRFTDDDVDFSNIWAKMWQLEKLTFTTEKGS
ncbi:hypothetical protein CCP3SC15_4540001 [Gammaproteobacteria bacterium]